MKTSLRRPLMAGVVVMAALAFVLLQASTQPAFAKKMSITGYLRDPNCFFAMSMSGEKHRKCALQCAKGGQNFILEQAGTGKLWLILAKKDKGNPTTPLLKYAERKVTITGDVFTGNGMSAITEKKVAPAR